MANSHEDKNPEEFTPGDSFSIRYRIPENSDIDILYANVLYSAFAGENFVMTLGQFPPKTPPDSPEEARQAMSREYPVRVVGQFAVPASAFVEAIENLYELIGRLRKRGLLPPRTEESGQIDAS